MLGPSVALDKSASLMQELRALTGKQQPHAGLTAMAPGANLPAHRDEGAAVRQAAAAWLALAAEPFERILQPSLQLSGRTRGHGDPQRGSSLGQPPGQMCGEIDELPFAQPGRLTREPLELRRQGLRVVSRKHEDFRLWPVRHQRPFRGARRKPVIRRAIGLERHVRVDAAESHGGNTRPDQSTGVANLALRERVEAAGLIDQRIVGTLEARQRGQDPAIDSRDRLDERAHSGRGLGVPDQGLERRYPDAAWGAVLSDRQLDAKHLGAVADRGPGAMTLDEVHVAHGIAGARIGPRQGAGLALAGGCHQASLAIRGDPDTPDRRIDAVTGGERVVEPAKHDKAAALPGQEAPCARVVDRHFAVGERPGLGEAHQLEGVEAYVDPPGERDVPVALPQVLDGRGDCQQGGGASTVDRVAAPMEVEEVADTTGDGVRESASERVFADRGERGVDVLLRALQQLAHLGIAVAEGRAHASKQTHDVWPPQPHEGRPCLLTGQGVSNDHAGGVGRQTGGARMPRILEGRVGHIER